MFGSNVGFLGSADLMEQLSNFKNPKWRLIAKSGHNLATGWPIHVMFHNINRKSLINCGLSIGSIDEVRSDRHCLSLLAPPLTWWLKTIKSYSMCNLMRHIAY